MPSLYEALGSILSTTKNQKQANKTEKEGKCKVNTHMQELCAISAPEPFMML
jgi:hypothetical protein